MEPRASPIEWPAPSKRLIGVWMLVGALGSWVPAFAFSALEGVAWGSAVRMPFLAGFAAHVRYLVAVPLLILAELVIDQEIQRIFADLTRSPVLPAEERPRLEWALGRASRARTAAWPMVLLAALALGSAAVPSGRFWFSSWHDGQLAGSWNALVALPFFRFLIFRWLYRVAVWGLLLLRIACLRLRLVATHPDRVAGLGFILVGHKKFALVAFAFSSVQAARVGELILFGGAELTSFSLELGLSVALYLALFTSPLLAFTPKLILAKRTGRLEYGALATLSAHAFDDQWVRREPRDGAGLIHSSDPQSLADLQNFYAGLNSMKLVLLDRETLVVLLVAALLPMVPLVFTAIPLAQALARVVKLLL